MGEAKRQVKEAAREAAPWVETLARAGYLARGVVYLVVALLAGRAALEHRRAAGTRGAFMELLLQPLGRVVLGVLTVGLLGYAAWRFVQAVLDPERKGKKLKALGKRASYLFTTAVYVGMAAAAARLALGGPPERDQFSAGRWVAPVMQHPWGRWAVLAAGVWIAAYGPWLLYRSVAKEPEKRLDTRGLSSGMERAAKAAGRVGVAARGVVFLVVGVWVVLAAWHARPSEAKTPAGALESLRQQPYGPWLLVVVAVGLGAFGLFEIVKARYRHITPAR
ncbi:MAG: DUF1206 domain-containing protein [Longimicrobiaceae bacterium]